MINIVLDDETIIFSSIQCDNKTARPITLTARTAQAKEYSLDKEQTSYDDLLDALRLSLKGYNIK